MLYKTTATFEIPPQDNLKEKVIDTLQEEMRKIEAEAFMKKKAIQEKINNLLAIEYKPEAV